MKVIRLLTLAAAVVIPALQTRSATVAYWDFETDFGEVPTNGQYVSHPTEDLVFYGAIWDLTDNYNDLSVYFAEESRFDDEVAYDNQTGSSFSYLRGSGYNALFSAGDLYDGGSLVGDMPTWSIEASVRFTSVSGWQTIVGKDGFLEDVATNDVAAILYVQKRGDNNAFRVNFLDADGMRQEVSSSTIATTGQWYHLAATSDGTYLRIYVNGILEAETDMSLSGSLDTAMLAVDTTKREGVSGPYYSWSVGRGMYNDVHGDRVAGYIDDVRISNVPLATNDMLFVYTTGVTVPPPAPAVLKLWVNGTTNKLYWSEAATATNYIVSRALTSGGAYTAVGETTNTFYYDDGLTVGTTYHYVISAENAMGEGPVSDELSGTSAGYTIFANSDSSWGDNIYNYREAAADGDTGTFYDSPNALGWVGLDLGTGHAVVPSQIAFVPRPGYANRVVGGIFQGSNDGSSYDNLITISNTPAAGWNYVYPETATAYRYLRYYTDTGYGNIAEMEFSAYTPPFYPVDVLPGDGSVHPSPVDITLQAVIVERGASFDSAELYLNGAVVATDDTPDPSGTNVVSYAAGALADGVYTGKVIAVSANPAESVTNSWTFTVYTPFAGDAQYNINFRNTGAEVPNGTVIVAPSSGSNIWNNLVNPNGGANAWQGEVPVQLVDVNGEHPIQIGWYGPDGRDFGSNTSLSDPLFQGYYGFGSFEDSVYFSRLNPAATYDIIVYFTWGWNENLVNYYLTEGTAAVTNRTLTPEQDYCNGGGTYSNIVEDVNYVIFNDITPSARGRIDIQAVSADGGFSGFQIMQSGTGLPGFDPVINTISISGGTATINWTSDVVGTYQIQSRSSLTVAPWSPVATGLVGGAGRSTAVPATGSERFYRVYGE